MEFVFINYKVKKQAEFVSGDSSWDNGYLWLGGVVKRKNTLNERFHVVKCH